MTALQTVNQGTAPAGTDGDTVRSAFTKMNSNVAVLNAQAALTSAVAITAAQALTAAHLGRRVNINLAAAGVVNVPVANAGGADSVVLLRNVGATVVTLAITAGSADTLALSKLNPGEAALLDTDGVHTWSVLMRGRTNSDNETVNGNCVVAGNVTSQGVVTAKTLLFGTASTAGNIYGYNASGAQVCNLGVGALSGDTGSLGITTLTSTGVLSLGTNTTERVRIDASGRVFVNGTGSASYPAAARFNVAYTGGTGSGGSEYGVAFRPSFDNTFPLVFGNAANSIIGSVQCSASATTYNTGSDYRLKARFSRLTSATSILSRIKFYEGEFCADPGKKRHYVIAHELQSVLDYAVTGKKDEVDDAGAPVYQGVDYSKLVPILGAALQEALARIGVLESAR